MTEWNMKNGLAEQIVEESFNACLCLELLESGEYRAVYVNKAFERMFSVGRERLCSCSLKEYIRDRYGADGLAGFEKLLGASGEARMESWYDGQKERYLWISAFRPVGEYICLLFLDMTGFERSREKVERMYEEISSSGHELRYQMDLLTATQNSFKETKRVCKLLGEHSADGFVYCNLHTGAVFASDKWRSIFPVPEEKAARAEEISACMEEEYRDAYLEEWRRAVTEQKTTEKFLYQMKKDEMWISQTSHFWYDGEGALKEFASFCQDITCEMLQRRELEKLTCYDSFTEVYNRNYFIQWLGEQIEAARQDMSLVQLLLVDIDHFKWVNDRLGIQIADELLLKVAAIVQHYESDSVKVARFSNDEFVIGIREKLTNDTADNVAEGIRDTLKTPILLSTGMKYYVTVSIGIAECDQEIENAEDLLRAADLAMMEAKKTGRNMITHYEPYMVAGFVGEADLRQKLQAAVEKGSFYLMYQPQYDADTERLRGVEALIRWHDEELGNISPALFIPIAEESGLIGRIGEFVIEEALKSLGRWVRESGYDGMMSINISAIQFQDGSFLDTLQYYRGIYGLDAKQIEIELTESVFIENLDDTIRLIGKIRELGYRVSLDDFGTGYSSLSYLRMVPIDTLKIDRSFITELSREKNTAIITSSIIEMAEKLGLEVIAEGVERQDQLEYLKEYQCGTIQGYLLGRPLKQEAVEELIKG